MKAAAREWIQHDRDPDYLYHGGRLSQAEEWAQDRRRSLSRDELAFLDARKDLRDTEAKRKEKQRQQELKQAKDLATERSKSTIRLKLVLDVIVLAFMGAAGIAGYAYQKKLEATAAREEAESQRREAVAAKDEVGKRRDLASC